jgi:hypothetical protein
MNQLLLPLFSLVQQKRTGPSDTIPPPPPLKKRDKRHNTVASKRLNPRENPVSFFSASYSTWEGAFFARSRTPNSIPYCDRQQKPSEMFHFCAAAYKTPAPYFRGGGACVSPDNTWPAVRTSVLKIEQMLQFDTKFILAAALVLHLTLCNNNLNTQITQVCHTNSSKPSGYYMYHQAA